MNKLETSKKALDGVVSFAGKGFRNFFKTSLLAILLIIAGRILTKPEILLDPIGYFKTLGVNALVSTLIIFFIIIVIYQLARSISNENTTKVEVDSFTDALSKSKREIDEENNKIHTDLVFKRLENGHKLRTELKDLLIRLGATRACICEMHNGTNNLAGTPFLYLDMTYEETIPQVDNMTDEFKNLNLSKYQFFNEHVGDLCWIGSIDKLNEEDHLLASKVNMYGDVSYGAVVVIRGTHNILGFIIVTFNGEDDIPSDTEIISSLGNSAQVVSKLLDKSLLMESIKKNN